MRFEFSDSEAIEAPSDPTDREMIEAAREEIALKKIAERDESVSEALKQPEQKLRKYGHSPVGVTEAYLDLDDGIKLGPLDGPGEADEYFRCDLADVPVYKDKFEGCEYIPWAGSDFGRYVTKEGYRLWEQQNKKDRDDFRRDQNWKFIAALAVLTFFMWAIGG